MEVYDGDWEANTRHGKGMLKVLPPMTRRREADRVPPRHVIRISSLRHSSEATGIMVVVTHWALLGMLPKYADGGYYLGAFDHERMHGRGLFVWPDGSQVLLCVWKVGGVFARARARERWRRAGLVEPGSTGAAAEAGGGGRHRCEGTAGAWIGSVRAAAVDLISSESEEVLLNRMDHA